MIFVDASITVVIDAIKRIFGWGAVLVVVLIDGTWLRFVNRAVAVVIEASHQCMTTRGIHKSNVSMVTSQMIGTFRKDARTRVEFLRMIDASR